MVMRKRSISLVFGFNIVLLLAMISSTLTNACMFNFHGTGMIIASMIIWYICWWLLLYFLTVKEWLVYFKHKWTFYTLQLKWQQIINTDTQSKTNWYIQNNHKYGNLKFVYKLFGTIYFAAFMVSSIAVMLMSNPESTSTVKSIAAGLQCIAVLPSILFYFILVICVYVMEFR